MQIEDHLHNRYRVVHKLGHGSYSTTWLAYDGQSNEYVAAKVCTADSGSREVNQMVPEILDTFTIRGPNGSYDCYVTTPARASLSGVKDGSWMRLFQLDVARALAAQLVLAVDYVHAQGIVHGGLHMGNVLLKTTPNFDQLSIDQLYEKYGAPELDPVVHLDSKPLPPSVPSHGIAPIRLRNASEDITPARFEPNQPLSFSSDIWTLACTIWTIIAQQPLFEEFLASEDDITCEHVDTLGVLPPEWWRRWDARRHKFTEDGRPINHNSFRSQRDRFEDSVEQPRRDSGLPSFDAKERNAIFDMLRLMLSFRPEDRSTTKQILDSEWMVKWGFSGTKRDPHLRKFGRSPRTWHGDG
ncbi:kinase-like protein [Aspergillus bertholletiae]|uniref:non-specific serine/threonine protein kinase n=1 Tax=Aspergillus bertholletiae TaxID=1226010 RepID=A0A5N7AWH1_9EURO|nr:kinase-like protein [Aspergillus bertholletiae]